MGSLPKVMGHMGCRGRATWNTHDLIFRIRRGNKGMEMDRIIESYLLGWWTERPVCVCVWVCAGGTEGEWRSRTSYQMDCSGQPSYCRDPPFVCVLLCTQGLKFSGASKLEDWDLGTATEQNECLSPTAVGTLIVRVYIYALTNVTSSWSDSEKNKMMPWVLFVWRLSVSVLIISLVSHVYMYTCIYMLCMCALCVNAYWEHMFSPAIIKTSVHGSVAALLLLHYWIQQLLTNWERSRYFRVVFSLMINY